MTSIVICKNTIIKNVHSYKYNDKIITLQFTFNVNCICAYTVYYNNFFKIPYQKPSTNFKIDSSKDGLSIDHYTVILNTTLPLINFYASR